MAHKKHPTRSTNTQRNQLIPDDPGTNLPIWGSPASEKRKSQPLYEMFFLWSTSWVLALSAQTASNSAVRWLNRSIASTTVLQASSHMATSWLQKFKEQASRAAKSQAFMAACARCRLRKLGCSPSSLNETSTLALVLVHPHFFFGIGDTGGCVVARESHRHLLGSSASTMILGGSTDSRPIFTQSGSCTCQCLLLSRRRCNM